MNGAHLHLMFNHVPSISVLVSLVFLFYSMIAKNESAKNFSLNVLFVSLLSVLIAYYTGEPAEKIVHDVTGVNTQAIHPHEEAAETSLALSMMAAFLAFVAMVTYKPKVRNIVIQLLIAASVLTMASYFYTAALGGKIHHQELQIQSN